MKQNKIISLIDKLTLIFLNNKKKNKTIAPIINLIEATESGWIFSTQILIAIKADPQIAERIINKNRLFKCNCFDKN